jgi:hypothetical protein
MHGIRLAHQMLTETGMPLIDHMTNETERFRPAQMLEAIERAADKDSLKVIIDWTRD